MVIYCATNVIDKPKTWWWIIYRFFPDWVKNKKASINPINNDDKFFWYAATVPLNHEEIGINSQRIYKNKSFLNNYNWKRITYPSEKDEWKKFEKNNTTFDLSVLYVEK